MAARTASAQASFSGANDNDKLRALLASFDKMSSEVDAKTKRSRRLAKLMDKRKKFG